jgi:hypothetical protein
MDEGQQTHTASPWLAFGLGAHAVRRSAAPVLVGHRAVEAMVATGLAVFEEDVIDSLLAGLAA